MARKHMLADWRGVASTPFEELSSREMQVAMLILEGQRLETLTGSGYLLLNKLEEVEVAAIAGTANGIDLSLQADWVEAVEALPTALTLIEPNTPYVKAALGARLQDAGREDHLKAV